MRADGNSWMTVYRKLDKTDNNPLVNLHLKTSEEKVVKIDGVTAKVMS